MDARAASAEKSGPYTPARGLKVLKKLFSRICSLAKTPLAIRAAHALEEGDWVFLTKIPFDPFFYVWNGHESDFELDYQIAAFFKKFQDASLGNDPEGAAYEKWLKAEESCKRVNDIFRKRWCGGSEIFPHAVEEVLYLARRKVTAILGVVKARDLDSIRRGSRHGPGSDLSCRRHLASGYEKYRTSGDITEPCVRAYDVVFGNEGNPSLTLNEDAIDVRQDLAHNARTVLASRLSFVAKNAWIKRPICVEPRWNVYLQLGIGEVLEKRLLRLGIDLQDQTKNQKAAACAYSQGLATLDLSSASDSIATNLVVDLLSDADPLWLDLLLWTRCAYTSYKKRLIRLEKISSMGNGYTFPLETVIFYALAWAACKYLRVPTRQVTVYGDDIILPRSASSLLTDVLTSLGFSVNTDKSYYSGNFFESCGKDYLRGREVRPFFVEKTPASLEEFYVLHNKVVEWSRVGETPFHDLRYYLAGIISSSIKRSDRHYGPTSIGGCLHSPFDVWGPTSVGALWGWEGLRVRSLQSIPLRKKRFDYRALLYTKLSRPSGPGNWVYTHGSDGSRVEWTLIPVIEDFFVDGPPPEN